MFLLTVAKNSKIAQNTVITEGAGTAKVYSVTRDLTNKTFADATAGDVGKVIGANGSIYDKASAATSAGTSAVAMIAYVGDDGTADASSEIYKGLAIALSDAGVTGIWSNTYESAGVSSSTTWADQKTFLNGIADTDKLITKYGADYAVAKAKNYEVAAPTGTSGWFLPSSGQWLKFFEAAGIDVASWTDWSWDPGGVENLTKVNTNLLEKAKSGSLLDCDYWTSSEYDTNHALSVDFSSTSGVTLFNNNDKKVAKLVVRPFFAF
jgi:hypothetical protein